MRGPQYTPTIKIPDYSRTNGIMVTVKRALREAGADSEYINTYLQKSMIGEREQLIPTAMKYVNITQ